MVRHLPKMILLILLIAASFYINKWYEGKSEKQLIEQARKGLEELSSFLPLEKSRRRNREKYVHLWGFEKK